MTLFISALIICIGVFSYGSSSLKKKKTAVQNMESSTLTDQIVQKKTNNNILTMAVAWKQTSAEYKALYHQGFNMAKKYVDEALKKRKQGDKPLAIITDVDDTVLSSVNYWGYLIENGIDFFDDAIWDEWVPQNKFIPTAGASEFLDYCKKNKVEVFYVTSRNQGEKTYEYITGNLKAVNFPYVDKEHLIVLMDTLNKEKEQVKIAEKYNVIVYLGDNLNDFKRTYYVKDVDERSSLMEKDKELYGVKYIIFPNPTDGHWIRAIFGDSEPPANDENRVKWEEAAKKNKWQK